MIDEATDIDNGGERRLLRNRRLQYMDYVDLEWRLTLRTVDVDRNCAMER
jgi:hypothetical protein